MAEVSWRSAITGQPKLLDIVALLDDRANEGGVRGQVGTVVDEQDEQWVAVEFRDNQGRGYAILPVERARLLVLHYEPVTA